MGLENATYIHQLLEQNPTTQDKMKQGDDHLRLLKKTIKNTFPEIKGPVLVSHETLNNIPASLTAIIAQLIAHSVRKGTIAAHDPQIAMPTGWAICDGATVPGYGITPDLRGRFIKGAHALEVPGVTGGAATANTSTTGSHNHSGLVGAIVLTVAQLAKHAHRLWVAGRGVSLGGAQNAYTSITDPGYTNSVPGGVGTGQLIEDEGQDVPHDHPISSDGGHNHEVATQPPYYVLVWIVKVTEYTAP